MNGDGMKSFRNMPLDNAEVPTARAYAALKNAGCTTMGDMMDVTREVILALPNAGKKTWRDISDMQAHYNNDSFDLDDFICPELPVVLYRKQLAATRQYAAEELAAHILHKEAQARIAGEEEYIKTAYRVAAQARIAELEAELHTMKTAGIIEVAVRNPSVSEYMAHWEGRAEKAESRVAELKSALEWYAEHVAGCRKLGRDGDIARGKLDRDGGTKAREALKGETSCKNFSS
jgi:hypothetical protein